MQVHLIKRQDFVFVTSTKETNWDWNITCKQHFSSLEASKAPDGKVTFEVTNHQCQEQKDNFFAGVIISDFCTPHHNFDLPLIMPAGTLNYLM